MTDSTPELLFERARATRVVVVGGGIAGLVAALECAKIGMIVTVVEASDRLGGVVRSAAVGELLLDVGAESYATRRGHVRALINELGLGDAVVTPHGGGAWVAGLPGDGAAPLPAGGVLGIPENPFAPDVVRVIGRRGAWRAYGDRLRPVLTIGRERSLGRLVRTRMGDAVLDRLVAPVTSGVYSAHPDDIDVDRAAPGLNSALTRAGSLSGAVAQLRADRPAAPGAAVEGLDGGMSRLVDALEARLRDLGVDLRLRCAVDAVETGDAARWVLRAAGEQLPADHVIVATTEAVARQLLAPSIPDLAAHSDLPTPEIEVVTLVVDAPELDAAPRGSGVLTVPGSHRAKALTHSSAKWAWVAREAAPLHVVRVSFGTQGEPPATAGMDDADAAALAFAEASALLGVSLNALVAAHRESYAQAQPASAIGQAAAADSARASIAAVPGLAAVGAWLSGTGLAQVVPDAIAGAERVRRAALWGDG